MKLVDNWKALLKQAWSVRLMFLASTLSGCEAVLNVVGVDSLPIPQWAKAGVVFVIVTMAAAARLVQQPELQAK